MKEYDNNTKEPIEYGDVLQVFGYVFILLFLFIVVLELRKRNPTVDSTENRYESLRCDLKTTEGYLFESFKKDTTYEHEKTTHKNPLLDE